MFLWTVVAIKFALFLMYLFIKLGSWAGSIFVARYASGVGGDSDAQIGFILLLLTVVFVIYAAPKIAYAVVFSHQGGLAGSFERFGVQQLASAATRIAQLPLRR